MTPGTPVWQPSRFGSSEVLDLDLIRIEVYYDLASKAPDEARWRYRFGPVESRRGFATAEEAKRMALASVRRRLARALQLCNELERPPAPNETPPTAPA